MNALYLTVGFYFLLTLQVSCNGEEDQSDSMDYDGLSSGVSEFFLNLNDAIDELGQNPVHLRSKRSSDADACHTFQTQALPIAKNKIYEAWNESINAATAITSSINDMKKCASWNPFVAIPCGLKALVEGFTTYKTYKTEIFQFFGNVKNATSAATSKFVGCAKILLNHRSNT